MAKKPKKSKRFKYNLETVLKYRQIRETQEQEKFTKARKKYESELEKEEKIKKFQKEKYLELAEKMSAGHVIDFQQVLMRRSHLDDLKGKVIEQEKSREEAEKKKEEQREELVKAVKDRKIMDKDKEKKRDAWKDLIKKEEGKFLDEIASIGFVRKMKMAENEIKEKEKSGK